MKQILLASFSLLLLCSNETFAQSCLNVSIETTPIITLPECNENNGELVLRNTNGGTPPYNYRLDTLSSLLGTFSNLSLGVYQLIIEDAKLCRDTLEVKLQYENIKKIIRPNNAFTPNDDNFNDLWFIPGIESFSGTEVRVFNRWGQMVHRNSEYTNALGWDGTQNGSKLPAATYYYIISIVNNCVKETLNGTVTIIR